MLISQCDPMARRQDNNDLHRAHVSGSGIVTIDGRFISKSPNQQRIIVRRRLVSHLPVLLLLLLHTINRHFELSVEAAALLHKMQLLVSPKW
jgi:hypothetical protein